MPGIVIACLSRLLQENVVALRVHPHEAKATCPCFILRQRDVFGWHLVSQTRTFLLAVRRDRVFNVTIDLVLRPIRSADKPIETRELQEQTHQAYPTSAHFRTHQVDPEHQSVQKGQPRGTLKKCHDGRTRVETLLVRAPRLKRGTGHLKGLGGLPLGEALGLQTAVLLRQLSAFESIPAWRAISVAS
jgi:hypothetical protein